MSGCRISPPWEFPLSASRNSLQSYELSRLGHASNLRKEITALVDQWVEENSSAMLARWLLENREREVPVVETPQASAQQAKAPSTTSDNFLSNFSLEGATTKAEARAPASHTPSCGANLAKRALRHMVTEAGSAATVSRSVAPLSLREPGTLASIAYPPARASCFSPPPLRPAMSISAQMPASRPTTVIAALY